MNWIYKQPPKVFWKKDVLRNFAKFTGKRLCQGLFFNKVAGLRTATLLNKRLWHRCFPASFAKSLRTPSLTEHLLLQNTSGGCFCGFGVSNGKSSSNSSLPTNLKNKLCHAKDKEINFISVTDICKWN